MNTVGRTDQLGLNTATGPVCGQGRDLQSRRRSAIGRNHRDFVVGALTLLNALQAISHTRPHRAVKLDLAIDRVGIDGVFGIAGGHADHTFHLRQTAGFDPHLGLTVTGFCINGHAGVAQQSRFTGLFGVQHQSACGHARQFGHQSDVGERDHRQSCCGHRGRLAKTGSGFGLRREIQVRRCAVSDRLVIDIRACRQGHQSFGHQGALHVNQGRGGALGIACVGITGDA